MLKAPAVSRDLLDYLEKVFAPAFFQCPSDTNPHTIAALVHRENGVQGVISHLRAVYEEQQNEDPTDVHQGT